MSLQRRPESFFEPLHELASKYPDIEWYVPGLIHKFSGLALLVEGNEPEGLERLERALHFFEEQFNPMMRLLGTTVRTEKGLYFLKIGQQALVKEDLMCIKDSLSLQKDIKKYFQNELKQLSRYLRFKNPGANEIEKVSEALDSIKKKIPY